jgi:hypothetical protein
MHRYLSVSGKAPPLTDRRTWRLARPAQFFVRFPDFGSASPILPAGNGFHDIFIFQDVFYVTDLNT